MQQILSVLCDRIVLSKTTEDGHNNDESNVIHDECCGLVIMSVHDE